MSMRGTIYKKRKEQIDQPRDCLSFHSSFLLLSCSCIPPVSICSQKLGNALGAMHDLSRNMAEEEPQSFSRHTRQKLGMKPHPKGRTSAAPVPSARVCCVQVCTYCIP
jgi:hypothetical protein